MTADHISGRPQDGDAVDQGTDGLTQPGASSDTAVDMAVWQDP